MAEVATSNWYRQGTVSVTINSTKVTGVGTAWLTAGINPGATFRISGLSLAYEVKRVVSDTEIELGEPYYGNSGSALKYSIDRNYQSTTNAHISKELTGLMGIYEQLRDGVYLTIEGKSAYQVAVENGYTGTVSQWLESLKAAGDYTTLLNAIEPYRYNGVRTHNAHYRGKNLGLFTEAQSAAIRAGTFDGLYNGDCWQFSNIPYTYIDENDEEKSSTYSGTMRIADLDYYLRCGDSDLTTHHIVVVPDTPLYNAPMNPTNTTEGGYVGSKMRTKYLRRAEAIFKACFGENHVLKHRILLTTTVTDDKPSAGAWCDSLVDLMNEPMVYGSYIFTPANDGVTIPYRYTEGSVK